MVRVGDIYKLNTHELPRRAGEYKEYQLDLIAPEKMGGELISIPAGATIEVDARLESVTEGILLTARVYATAIGECIRCLERVEVEIDRSMQELFFYESKSEQGSKKRRAVESDELEVDDELHMDGDLMDLEAPLRDVIVLALPTNPRCSQGCAGLCPECGVKRSLLPQGHAHEVIDPRWAALDSINLDFKN